MTQSRERCGSRCTCVDAATAARVESLASALDAAITLHRLSGSSTPLTQEEYEEWVRARSAYESLDSVVVSRLRG